MKMTFVIPSRNNLEFLQLAYRSIRNLNTVHEILVLDDASTDGTHDWIESLKDDDLVAYRNPGPERIGIVGMFDKGIEMSETDIVFAFHADMIAGPNLDANILKHLKPGSVVCATRIEPPLHPLGPEKITMNWGDEVNEVDFDKLVKYIGKLEEEYKDVTTQGIFAPWCMYKSDYLSIGGHDDLFAPQSKEDSDLFNRFSLKGYELIQSWDGLVYHFTSRGSRFNKHVGGSAGNDSKEWMYTTSKNARNFIRKWGHYVKHDKFMKPIVPPKYEIGIRLKNANLDLIRLLEPWCDKLYVDDETGTLLTTYILEEQKNTKYDLKKRIFLSKDLIPDTDILLDIDKSTFNQEDFHILQLLPDVIKETNEVGIYEIGNMKIEIAFIEECQNELIDFRLADKDLFIPIK